MNRTEFFCGQINEETERQKGSDSGRERPYFSVYIIFEGRKGKNIGYSLNLSNPYKKVIYKEFINGVQIAPMRY